MEWFYVNRITIALVTFLVSLFLMIQLHNVAIKWVYEEPTSEYNLIGGLTASQLKTAMEITENDNKYLDKFRGDLKTTKRDIEIDVERDEFYITATEKEKEKAVDRIYEKLQTVNSETLRWFEVLISFVFMMAGYVSPLALLIFQYKMRLMEMEDEVMQFQTIILMLMRIERVNVEIILEWLERYSNIFRETISRCVNNYEAGAWEALEVMKNDTNYPLFIRICESLQAAVEKIPIIDAFDELDSEREYYQAKRQESNERLIKRKGMIGKVIGFAPMVTMFVGYLIVPLVWIGLTSMTNSMSSIS